MGHATTGTPAFVGYHGTSSIHVPSLLAGVHAPARRTFADGQLGEGFSTTTDYVTARVFATVATRSAGGAPVVLVVFVYNFEQMHGAVVPAEDWWQIPARYLTDFNFLRAPIIGFAPVEQLKFDPRAYGAVELR